MNRGELETAVRARLGVRSSDPDFTDTIVDDFIRSGVQFVSALRDWPWLDETATFTPAADDNTETLAADCARVRSVTVAGVPYEEVSMAELREWDTAESRRPYVFATYEGILYRRPTPGEAGTANSGVIDYVKQEPLLTADSGAGATPLLPSRFHDMIVEYACMLGFRRAGNIPEADACEKAYNKWERRLLDETRRAHGPKRVKVTRDW